MAEEKKISTDELLRLLFQERSLEQILQRTESAYLHITFADYLSNWCKSRGEVPEQLIRRANLDVASAQEMLKVARKSLLYPRIKRDTVIIYCLHNRVSLVDTEIILQDLGLPILGGRDQ